MYAGGRTNQSICSMLCAFEEGGLIFAPQKALPLLSVLPVPCRATSRAGRDPLPATGRWAEDLFTINIARAVPTILVLLCGARQLRSMAPRPSPLSCMAIRHPLHRGRLEQWLR